MKKTIAILLVGIFMISMIPLTTAGPTTSNRQISKAQNEQLVQAYNVIKNKYQNTKTEWNNARNSYMAIKPTLTNNVNSLDSAEHVSIVKNFLTKTLERMENHIEILESWLNRVITDKEEYLELTGELDGYKEQITEYKEEVENANTIQELREISSEIKEFWKDVREKLNKHVGIVLIEKVNEVIKRTEASTEKLQEKIDSLDQNNKQVSEMQDLLNGIDEDIKLAKEKYNDALDIYTQEQSATSLKETLKEIKELLSEAKKHLRDAHKGILDVVKLYRQYMGEFPTLTAAATPTEQSDTN
jgi:hypothetical protein